jgi:NitT/TauT family transport system substrate-binding protein
MKIENKKLLIVVIVTVTVIVAVATTTVSLFLLKENDNNTSNLGAEKERPIRIALSPWVGNVGLVLAADEFKKDKVPVELLVTENATKAEELYANGMVDGLSSTYTDTIFRNSEGVNSRLVWVIDYSGTADAIIGSQNITIADLKGKKIGIEGINTFSHIFVLQTLAKSGLYERDVQFEDIPAQDILRALDNKQIDAGHTWGPTKFAAIQNGYNVLATAKDVPGIISDVLIFNSKVVDERPDDIETIVKSINEGINYLHNNREKSSQALSNFFNMSRDEVQDGFEGIKILDLKENVQAMNLSTTTTTTITTSSSSGGGGDDDDDGDTTLLYPSGVTIAKYLLDRGQIRQMPNFDQIIDPRFVYALYNNNSMIATD